MENIMAKLPDELIPGMAQLRCIWNVSVDKTYRIVRKNEEITKKHVALRTLSGSGEITLRSGKTELCSANTIDIFSANQIEQYQTVLNCTPFVRQYDILSNRWGDFYGKGTT